MFERLHIIKLFVELLREVREKSKGKLCKKSIIIVGITIVVMRIFICFLRMRGNGCEAMCLKMCHSAIGRRINTE